MDNYLKIDEPRASLFVDILRTINTVNDEVRVLFTPEGLKHASMDPGRIMLINLEIPGRFFDDYRFIDEYALTFNLKDALKQLRTVNKKSSLTLIVEDGRLLFKIREGSRSVDKRIPLLENLDDETPIPQIIFRARARILTGSLKETLKDMQLIGSNMSLRITDQVLHIGSNDERLSADSEYERGADDLLDIHAEEPSLSVFTTDYLLNIVNTLSRISEAVEISISNDLPIKVGAELRDVNLTFYLAPCQGAGHAEGLGAEAVKWIPRPILVYHPEDTPELLTQPEAAPIVVSPESVEPEADHEISTLHYEEEPEAVAVIPAPIVVEPEPLIRTPSEYLDFLHKEKERLSAGDLNMDQYLAELDQVRAQLPF
jgi:hypothetical protein